MSAIEPKDIRLYCKWLYQLIDRYAWGMRTRKAKAQHANTLARLASARQWRNWRGVTKLTRRHVTAHLDFSEVIFYTSNRSKDRALICIDIDAHQGEEDAEAVAAWIIKKYFHAAYYEPSTGGRGRHLYLCLDIGWDMATEKVNAYLADFGRLLGLLVAAEGFKAGVCGVYGTVTSQRKYGLLVKLPRPETKEQLERLLAMPVYGYADLRRVAVEGMNFEGGNRNAGETVPPDVMREERAPAPASNVGGGRLAALARKRGVVFDLARNLHRMPTVAEATARYLAMGLNHSPPAKDRTNDFEQIIAFCARTFDQSKISPNPHLARPDAYRAIVAELVTDRELRDKSGRPIRRDDLAWFIACIVQGAFEVKDDPALIGCTSREGVMAFFRKLKQAGLHDHLCSAKKYSAMLDICERHVILERFAQHVPPLRMKGVKVVKGKGRRLGPGLALPELRAEFVAFCSRATEAPKTKVA